jgi:hypothetical protein
MFVLARVSVLERCGLKRGVYIREVSVLDKSRQGEVRVMVFWNAIWLKNTTLRHNDTSLWPMSKTLRHAYTTFSLHKDMFWPHSWALCLNDITFRLHYRTFRLQSRPLPSKTILIRSKTSSELPDYRHAVKASKMTRCSSCTGIVTPDIHELSGIFYIDLFKNGRLRRC